MVSILLCLSLFLQLMAGAEAAFPRHQAVDPAVLCGLHPRQDAPPDVPQRDRHALCCTLACAACAVGIPALPADGPALPPLRHIALAFSWPGTPPPPVGDLRPAYGARAPPPAA
ncbi:hypothetical protein [Teichococcus oryzae]|uniref:DUF2946 domain-containing protein n=1 Tax=Teichococcus oryzae TaxID=1608942 RepID=A0A5B2TLF2_9PROT|nr:hypothetical protein [Pseudoroseomonas oryzae]KAA2214835.1 hypothetical protein F0Q34_03890 [Pseudoroseomonas oryzae]